jgi:transcription-repair coupling factor (superfamily II helicase)
LQIDAHIPEQYIPSLADRLDIYRKIASLKSNDQSLDLTDELIDRYGDPPDAIQGLITVALVRNRASASGITEITQKGGDMVFTIKRADPRNVQNLVAHYKRRVTIYSGERPRITVKLSKELPLELVQCVVDILDSDPDSGI